MSRKSSSKPISDALRMALGLKQKRNLYMTPAIRAAQTFRAFTPLGLATIAGGMLTKGAYDWYKGRNEEEEVTTNQYGRVMLEPDTYRDAGTLDDSFATHRLMPDLSSSYDVPGSYFQKDPLWYPQRYDEGYEAHRQQIRDEFDKVNKLDWWR